MSLVSPQKISEPLDASPSFHKRNGKRCQICIHVKKLNTIQNPASQKFNKNHNKIVDTHVNIMEKISGFLELN